MTHHREEDRDKAGEPAEHMRVDPDYLPRKAADVLELDMEDGLIVYNHDSSLVHHLNPSAMVIWGICDGEATVGQLAAEVADEYSLVGQNVLRDLQSLIAELDALGLIEDARVSDA